MSSSKLPTLKVAAAVVLHRGRVLLQQRTKDQGYEDFWETPGGKVESGEDSIGAVKRELMEEVGIVPVALDDLKNVQATMPDGREVEIAFYSVDRFQGRAAPREGQRMQWLTLDKALRLQLLPGDRAAILALATLNSAKHWNRAWRGDRYSRDGLRTTRAQQKAEILSALGLFDQTPEAVLDIGSGAGNFATQFPAKPSRYVALDRDEIALARASASGLESVHASAEDLPFEDGTFEVVLLVGVVEHVPDLGAALAEARRVLAREGAAYFVTSSPRSLVHAVRRCREMLGLWPYGFQRNMTEEEFTLALREAGFDVRQVRVDQTGWDFPVSAFVDRLLSKLFKQWGRYVSVGVTRNG